MRNTIMIRFVILASFLLLLLLRVDGVTTQSTTAPSASVAATSPVTSTTTKQSTTATTSPSGGTTTNPSQSTTTANDDYDEEVHVEYEGYDGWYNNFAHPDWGAVDTPLLRRSPPRYKDGVYQIEDGDRPNPIDISDAVMAGKTGRGSYRNRTALLVFFGQQVVEEILDAQGAGCPPEYHNIKIPKGHKQFDPQNAGGKEMPFLRTRYDMRTGFSPNNPRQQLNEISAWIDGNLMYGTTKAWADALRTFKDGLLAATNDTDPKNNYFPAVNKIRLPMANPPPPRDHYLKNVNRFFKLGNPRGNENPFLLTFGILWFRFHNYKARQLKAAHPKWDDERLFNEARKWTIATHQKLVAYDWLPSWIGEDVNGTAYGLGDYKGYDPTIDPSIAQVFQTAAMRYGHTLVPPGVYRRTANCTFRRTSMKTKFADKPGLRTCNTYWNPQEAVTESDIDELLMGMASQITEREDHIVTPDLRGNVFGPLEFSRRDLMAVNIQRGRDHGTPDYNTVRMSYGLEPIRQFKDINPEVYSESQEFRDIIKNLENLYANTSGGIDNLDIWPAGLLETTPRGPGELFRTVILDQFRRIRDGDRFWFENYKRNKLFTAKEVEEIKNTTIRSIILAVTDIPESAIQQNPFFHMPGDPCPQHEQLDETMMENCTVLQHFDYFSGSEVSFILTFFFLGLSLVVAIIMLWLCARQHQKKIKTMRKVTRQKSQKKISSHEELYFANEWVKKGEERNVLIKFLANKKAIILLDENKKQLRHIELSHIPGNTLNIHLSVDKYMRVMCIKLPKEYDLVLKFENSEAREKLLATLEQFLGAVGMGHKRTTSNEREVIKLAITKVMRQQLLEKFFRVIFSHAFKFDSDPEEIRDLQSTDAKEIITCELTKHEFAEVLSMKPNSLFVDNMFKLIDKDQNNFISFREFLDMIIIFSKGTSDDKARLLFDMYDLNRSGMLSRDEFRIMLKSLMELANATLDDKEMEALITSMFSSDQYSNKAELSFEDFTQILNKYGDTLKYAQLQWDVSSADLAQKMQKGRVQNAPSRARQTIILAYQSENDEKLSRIEANNRISSMEGSSTLTYQNEYPTTWLQSKWNAVVRYVENNRLNIFWLVLYTAVTIGIFAERAYYYSVEREHAGLRRIAGYGVTVTRGAASGMMWTYSCLLVTMCRNTITFLRETFLHQFIPFDSAIAMHKYIALWALLFTVMHCIGHSINFYHIATQTANDLSCLFRDFFHATHELPKFHYWCWQTITGFTGIILTVIIFFMYTFATSYARRHAFRAFWITHNFYILLFIFMFLHGSGNLVQPPFMHFFGLGPIVLFTLDQLVSISRKKIEIAVVKAEMLPSDVTMLEFERPQNFEYKSGQWVRVAHLNSREYHPFTLTSAPHEENLSLHIRAVGPWTNNLRHTYVAENKLPLLYLDGPYGEGHQDWYKFEVSVLVGGGIGVTPFASILKDIAHKSKAGSKFVCKKVYFLWVTRTQKHFEWLTDIIREVEEKDLKQFVSVHIFVTQFQQKFDLRTTMLYVCERHFQKISSRSIFTGLRSITHFGRPDFKTFFKALQQEHMNVSKIGVFSCGPPPMTSGVDSTCSKFNASSTAGPVFIHHFENF